MAKQINKPSNTPNNKPSNTPSNKPSNTPSNKPSNTPNKVRRRELTPEEQERFMIYKSLPFKNRKMTFAQWIERNSLPAMITFFVCIFGFVVLVSARFEIENIKQVDGILIEMPPVEIEEPEEVPEEKNEQLEIEKMLELSNVVADANAKQDAGKLSKLSQELLDQAKEVQDRLDENKEEYEDGLNEIKNINANSSGKKADSNKKKKAAQSTDNKSEDKRIPAISKKGNVTVEYDLKGRYATYLPIPAYKCQDGGKVIVAIIVDQNGDVINASIKGATSSKSVCIREMALQYAKESRFDVNSSALNRQLGTITYIFLSQ